MSAYSSLGAAVETIMHAEKLLRLRKAATGACENPVKFLQTKPNRWPFMVVLLCLFGLVTRPHFAQFDSTDNGETEISSMNFEFPAGPQFTFVQDTSLGCLILSHHSSFAPQVPIQPTKQTSS